MEIPIAPEFFIFFSQLSFRLSVTFNTAFPSRLKCTTMGSEIQDLLGEFKHVSSQHISVFSSNTDLSEKHLMPADNLNIHGFFQMAFLTALCSLPWSTPFSSVEHWYTTIHSTLLKRRSIIPPGLQGWCY